MVQWLYQLGLIRKPSEPQPAQGATDMKATTNAINAVTSTQAETTVDQIQLLAHELLLLGTKANQEDFALVVTGRTIAELVAVDSYGGRISGSAERALAALFNTLMPFDWFHVEHRDNTDDAKALKPHKTECFTAWKNHANPSTKYSRVRVYGFELRYPAQVTGEVVGEEREASEGATGGVTSRTRDLYARAVVEIGKLFRALNSTENDEAIKAHPKGAELAATLEHLTSALKVLGAPLEDDDLKAFMAAQK